MVPAIVKRWFNLMPGKIDGGEIYAENQALKNQFGTCYSTKWRTHLPPVMISLHIVCEPHCYEYSTLKCKLAPAKNCSCSSIRSL